MKDIMKFYNQINRTCVSRHLQCDIESVKDVVEPFGLERIPLNDRDFGFHYKMRVGCLPIQNSFRAYFGHPFLKCTMMLFDQLVTLKQILQQMIAFEWGDFSFRCRFSDCYLVTEAVEQKMSHIFDQKYKLGDNETKTYTTSEITVDMMMGFSLLRVLVAER